MVKKPDAVPAAVANLYREVRAVLDEARSSAYRAVNTAMVQSYWQVGRLIVEHEQGGKKRAAYGEAVLNELSKRLTAEFGRGFDARNVRKMRQFYVLFPIHHAMRDELAYSSKMNAVRSQSRGFVKRHAVRAKSQGEPLRAPLRPELSWTHYRLLLRVESFAARDWYMNEAADQHWSVRQLERQISVLYYERRVASRNTGPVRREAKAKLAKVSPEQFIRDPYVLEFLDLKDYPGPRETGVEQAIVDNIQTFLLELGTGFSFVARQKRMRFDEQDFYVDLVFYNYLLRCFVLVDLKVGKLTHQDVGQMDSYVRMFDAHQRPEGDNPTIGLILCSNTNETIAKYSVLSDGRRIFAAEYVKVLPTEEALAAQIERERRLIEKRNTHQPPWPA
jgi:predicted nuclease of restriction endonuclease-like (RecB) superfamily